MTPLQKKREQAWTQWKENAGLEQDDKRLSANFSSSDMRSAIYSGFDAMYAEHERIVKGLLEALEFYKDCTKNSFGDGKSYDEDDGAKAFEALEAYKRECGE